MIVVTVFLLIMKHTKFRLVRSQKQNYSFNHIPFISKEELQIDCSEKCLLLET